MILPIPKVPSRSLPQGKKLRRADNCTSQRPSHFGTSLFQSWFWHLWHWGVSENRYSIRYTLPWPFDWKKTDDKPVDQWIGPNSQTNPKPTPAAHGHAGRKRLPCYRWLKHMCGGQAFLTLWAKNKRSIYQTHKNYIGLHSHFTRILISLTVSASGSAYFRFPQSHWKFHRHPSSSPPILCFDGCLYVTLTRFVHEDVPPRLQNKSEGQFQGKWNKDQCRHGSEHRWNMTKPWQNHKVIKLHELHESKEGTSEGRERQLARPKFALSPDTATHSPWHLPHIFPLRGWPKPTGASTNELGRSRTSHLKASQDISRHLKAHHRSPQA